MREPGGWRSIKWWMGAVAAVLGLVLSAGFVTNPTVVAIITMLLGILTPAAAGVGTREARRALMEPPPIKETRAEKTRRQSRASITVKPIIPK